MKIFLSILFLFLGVQSEEEKIIWNKDRPLTWEDFRAQAPRNASFVASTNTGISFGYSFTNTNGKIDVKFSVESFIHPNKSWFQKDKVDGYILAHEQTHFDISELYSRILKKNLGEQNFTTRAKAEIEKIYHQNEKQRRIMQAQFDTETDHSRNETKELFWRKHVSKQLKKYESWH